MSSHSWLTAISGLIHWKIWLRHGRWRSSGYSLKSTHAIQMQGQENALKRSSRKLCFGTDLEVARRRRRCWDGLRMRPVGYQNKFFQGTRIVFLDAVEALIFLNRSGSTTNLFVPFTWCCVIYTACLKASEGFPETRGWNVLVGTIAIFFDSILHTSGKARHAITKATKVRLRRALRYVSVALSSRSRY